MIGRRGRWWVTCVVTLLLAAPAFAEDRHASLRALFAMDERELDYATAKIVVDRLIDPARRSRNPPPTRSLGARHPREHPADATPGQRFAALVDTLYQSGPWNDGRPFTYDLEDPLGKVPANKRLATYLATRKGNCISMPILVLILGQRLGLPLALATAPRHVFVKVHDTGEQSVAQLRGHRRRLQTGQQLCARNPHRTARHRATRSTSARCRRARGWVSSPGR
jgi:hypothetical protein